MDFAHLVKQVYSYFVFYLFVFVFTTYRTGCQDLKEFTIVRSQLITECKEKQIPCYQCSPADLVDPKIKAT